MLVLGADAAGRHGWVGVAADESGVVDVQVAPTVAELVAAVEQARGQVLAVVGVDIPVGLVAAPRRQADVAARAYVGPGRASSVFAAPHPDVVHARSQAEANELLRRWGLPMVSAQGFQLFARVREVRALAVDPRFVEVFPEASFRALAGGPLAHSKKTWNGQLDRRRLLAGARPPMLPADDLGPAGRVPVDDVLDAAAAAWSAARVARGEAEVLGDPTELDAALGRPVAVFV